MSVEGKWNVTMDTPLGTLRFAWEFTNANGQWEGRMLGQGPISDSQLHDIRVSGDSVSFKTTTTSPMGPIDLTFEGNIADGRLSGRCKTRFGDNDFSAVRGA
ncbi:MAG TPA: hypothetical protein VIL28_00310 [Steroidobacteraceae bacterium]